MTPRGERNKRSNRAVVIVPDDARVVTYSELHRLYEIAGDQRTVAEALGVSVSTICRALKIEPEKTASRAERLAAVRKELEKQ